MSEAEFRGLDYNKIKAEYVDMSAEELEEKMYVLAMKSQKANSSGDIMLAVECMARIGLISEVAEEKSKK